jgi:hypothetical protein
MKETLSNARVATEKNLIDPIAEREIQGFMDILDQVY